MDKDFIISITGRQMDEHGRPTEAVEFVTSGSYLLKDGAYVISYNESELTGLDGTTTTLSVDGGRVTIVRNGAISSQMVFEKGRRHISCYDTDLGALTVSVNADSIRTRLDDSGGEIEVGYELEIDNAVAGSNIIHVNISESAGPTLKQ